MPNDNQIRKDSKDFLGKMMDLLDLWLRLDSPKDPAAKRMLQLRARVAQRVLARLLGYVEGVALLLGVPEERLDLARRAGRASGLRLVALSTKDVLKECSDRAKPLNDALWRLTSADPNPDNRSGSEDPCPLSGEATRH